VRRSGGIVLVISFLVIGCGGSDGVTRGSQCMQVIDVFCARAANDCQLIPTDQIDECESSGLMTCCAGNCAPAAISTQAEIDVCITDLDAASCGALDTAGGGTLPATCQGVVRSASSSSP
jgi:hypothetical protein